MKLMMFGSMDTFMLLQILRSLESLAADLTGMWFKWCVNCIVSHVLLRMAVYAYLEDDW
jgi:hypothetical protein